MDSTSKKSGKKSSNKSDLEPKKIPTLPFLKQVQNLFHNPIFVFVLTGIIGLSWYFFVERKEIEPRYLVGDITYIANVTEDAPNFKMYWDDRQITNINSVTVALWNSGKQFLGNENISDSDPIKIIFPSDIEVLQVEIINKSRSELYFNYEYYPSAEDKKSIIINIVGDEALEKNDGVQIKIYYTGDSSEEFNVVGRIFGTTEGFEKAIINPTDLVFTTLNIILVLATTLFNIGSLTQKNYKGIKKYALWTILIIFILFLIFLIIYAIIQFTNTPLIPKWIEGSKGGSISIDWLLFP